MYWALEHLIKTLVIGETQTYVQVTPLVPKSTGDGAEQSQTQVFSA